MKQESARLHAAAPRWDPDWQAGCRFRSTWPRCVGWWI